MNKHFDHSLLPLVKQNQSIDPVIAWIFDRLNNRLLWNDIKEIFRIWPENPRGSWLCNDSKLPGNCHSPMQIYDNMEIFKYSKLNFNFTYDSWIVH